MGFAGGWIWWRGNGEGLEREWGRVGEGMGWGMERKGLIGILMRKIREREVLDDFLVVLERRWRLSVLTAFWILGKRLV